MLFDVYYAAPFFILLKNHARPCIEFSNTLTHPPCGYRSTTFVSFFIFKYVYKNK